MSTPAATRLFDKADFQIPQDCVSVCAGGESPFLRSHAEAYSRYAADKGNGYNGRCAIDGRVGATRARLAAMWHTSEDRIGFSSSVADGMSLLAESLALGPGDSVVFAEQEYPSVVLPFLALSRRHGFQVRLAPDASQIPKFVGRGVKLIGASYVSYLNGGRIDLGPLRELADSVGALLAIDFTQAAGYTPIHADLCDFAFSSCYKWLLGTTGVAVAYWNRVRQPDWRPNTAGWHSVKPSSIGGRPGYAAGVALKEDAMCFARGNPAHLPIYILDNALHYLSRFAVEAVDAHVHVLTTALLKGLRNLGLPVITPDEPGAHGASVAFEASDSETLTNRLAKEGVLAWGGVGRVRFSFHGFNALDDVSAILTVLRKAL